MAREQSKALKREEERRKAVQIALEKLRDERECRMKDAKRLRQRQLGGRGGGHGAGAVLEVEVLEAGALGEGLEACEASGAT